MGSYLINGVNISGAYPGLKTFTNLLANVIDDIQFSKDLESLHNFMNRPIEYSCKVDKSVFIKCLIERDDIEFVLPKGYKTRNLGIQRVDVSINTREKLINIDLQVRSEFLRFDSLIEQISDYSLTKKETREYNGFYSGSYNGFQIDLNNLLKKNGLGKYHLLITTYVNAISACDKNNMSTEYYINRSTLFTVNFSKRAHKVIGHRMNASDSTSNNWSKYVTGFR